MNGTLSDFSVVFCLFFHLFFFENLDCVTQNQIIFRDERKDKRNEKFEVEIII